MRWFATLLILGVVVGCGRQPAAAPTSNQASSAPPDLSSMPILMLPVQPGAVPSSQPRAEAAIRFDGVNQLDAEISYWVRERAGRVRWILPETLERTLARTPTLDIKLRALDVASFRRAQVRRIGDPLFGDLRRLAAIHDARLALVPVAAEFRVTAAAEGHIEVALALIDTSFGDVVWFGVVAGDPGPPDSPAVAASAAQRVAALFAR